MKESKPFPISSPNSYLSEQPENIASLPKLFRFFIKGYKSSSSC